MARRSRQRAASLVRKRRDVPDDRIGFFVSVWMGEIKDLETLLDYSVHFRWTIERRMEVSVGNGVKPAVLAGTPSPLSSTLMRFPSSKACFDWYNSPEYVSSYRGRRLQASIATVIGIPARPGVVIPPHQS